MWPGSLSDVAHRFSCITGLGWGCFAAYLASGAVGVLSSPSTRNRDGNLRHRGCLCADYRAYVGRVADRSVYLAMDILYQHPDRDFGVGDVAYICRRSAVFAAWGGEDGLYRLGSACPQHRRVADCIGHGPEARLAPDGLDSATSIGCHRRIDSTVNLGVVFGTPHHRPESLKNPELSFRGLVDVYGWGGLVFVKRTTAVVRAVAAGLYCDVEWSRFVAGRGGDFGVYAACWQLGG